MSEDTATDGAVLGEAARDAVALAFWGSTTREAYEMADIAINALEPHLTALVARTRADGAAEERERIRAAYARFLDTENLLILRAALSDGPT